MFRASPWVPYDPTTDYQSPPSNKMDRDIDMDAPQISTLREEETPPPQPKVGARRGKAANKVVPLWPRPRPKERHIDEEYDDAEEPEEDQLIDDDDDKPVPPAALSHSGRSIDGTSKRKTPSKRKRKVEKKVAEDEKKPSEKAPSNPAGVDLATTISSFKAAPQEEDNAEVDVMQTDHIGGEDTPKSAKELAAPPGKTPRKPAAPRTKKAPKQKTALPILADDTGIASEGYTGTAASSPATGHFEAVSPEPEPIPSVDTAEIAETAPLMEDTAVNLENVPLPIYPLPTKPFPVQPPPKIATGFAPAATLDKHRQKVRHWRVAQREIRGIGGGRWFVRSWVGERDSEYATAVKNVEEKGPLPRLVGGASISAPVGKGSSKGKKTAASSLAASVAPSRSGSAIPDAPQTGTIRAPTKMRTIIGPPSEGGESDGTAIPVP